MTGFGANILAQFVADRAGVEAHLIRLNPPALVVMDDHAWAVALKRRLPRCTVIFRRYDKHDPIWHEGRSADEIWAIHQMYAVEEIAVQIWNEPSGYGNVRESALDAAAVVRLAHAAGKLAAVPNWGVGHPGEAELAAGLIDPLIDAWYDCPEQPIAAHEYFVSAPHQEQPYHIGRYRYLLARAKQIGKPLDPARIILTEHGRDQGGGENDGWRAHYTPLQYVALLYAAMGIYHNDGIRAACIFCVGKGAGGQWRNFDYEGDSTLYAMMEVWNEDHPMTQTQPAPPAPETLGEPFEAQITQVQNLFVNLRALPSAASDDLGDLKVGMRVTARPKTWTGNGYRWRRFENPAGWAADNLLALLPVEEVDTPRVKLPVPYVSQLGADANAIDNDCPDAVALSLIQYNLKRYALPTMTGLKVNMLVAGGDLRPRADTPRDADYILALLRDFAADGEVLSNVTPAQMVALLDETRPFAALTTYDVVKPGDEFTGNHWVVVVGYGQRGFYCLDPYRANGEVYIRTEALMAGMRKAYPSPRAVALKV